MSQTVPEVEVSSLPPTDECDIYLLDVREDDEWTAGHIAGAVHIPMMQVPGRIEELPDQGPVVVVCRSGHRSAAVVDFLSQRGHEAFNLSGGMHAWIMSGRTMVSEGQHTPRVL